MLQGGFPTDVGLFGCGICGPEPLCFMLFGNMEYQTKPNPVPAISLHLPSLPLELLVMIARFLPTRSVSFLSRSCRTLYFLLTPLLDTLFTEEASGIIIWAAARNRSKPLSRALAVNRTKLRGSAVDHAQAQKVRQLLLDKEAVDPKATDLTPLLRAVYKGDNEVAKILLNAGADVHMADGGFFVMTPVDAAMMRENWEMVGLLLEFGALKPLRSNYYGRVVPPIFY